VRSPLVVSSIAHAAFLALVIAPGLQQARVPASRVINVSLVAAEKPPPVSKPKAEPKKTPPPPRKEPPKSKMAYKPEKKPAKTRETVKQTAPKNEPAAKPAAARSTSQKTEGKSTIRVDDADFKFGYYLEIVKERVSSNWSPPPVRGSPEGVVSTVYFRIRRNGSISDARIESSSGFELYDRSAIRAVGLADPLPPLPAGFKGKWLGVHFEFVQSSG
jgi:protein TonB